MNQDYPVRDKGLFRPSERESESDIAWMDYIDLWRSQTCIHTSSPFQWGCVYASLWWRYTHTEQKQKRCHFLDRLWTNWSESKRDVAFALALAQCGCVLRDCNFAQENVTHVMNK